MDIFLNQLSTQEYSLDSLERLKEQLIALHKAQHSLLKNKLPLYRDHLQEQGKILLWQKPEQPWNLIGSDCASIVGQQASGAQVIIAGVTSSLEAIFIRDARIYSIPDGTHVDDFASLARLELELSIVKETPAILNTYLALDNSLRGIPIAINRSLSALTDYQKAVGKVTSFVELWLDLLAKVAGPEGLLAYVLRNCHLISLTKTNICRHHVDQFIGLLERRGLTSFERQVLETLNDKVLLEVILEPGEYLQPYVEPIHADKNPRQKYREFRSGLVDMQQVELLFSAPSIQTTYFKSRQGQRIQKIEYDGRYDLNTILATLDYYSIPEIPEVVVQVQTDLLCKRMVTSLNQWYQSLLCCLIAEADSQEDAELYYALFRGQRS